MTPSTAPTERKATLYCPTCGHGSNINGDWTIHVLNDSITYECPKCEMEIDSRRNQRALITGSGGALQFAAED